MTVSPAYVLTIKSKPCCFLSEEQLLWNHSNQPSNGVLTQLRPLTPCGTEGENIQPVSGVERGERLTNVPVLIQHSAQHLLALGQPTLLNVQVIWLIFIVFYYFFFLPQVIYLCITTFWQLYLPLLIVNSSSLHWPLVTFIAKWEHLGRQTVSRSVRKV